MRSVVVDDETGVATVQVGARNIDVYKSLQPYEAAISAGCCPTVAIGGLVLGGGIGFSSRRGADTNLQREKDRRSILGLSRRQRGNFGVNVPYTFQATPVQDVSISDLQWNLEDGEKVPPALQEIALKVPHGFSCRMGPPGHRQLLVQQRF